MSIIEALVGILLGAVVLLAATNAYLFVSDWLAERRAERILLFEAVYVESLIRDDLQIALQLEVDSLNVVAWQSQRDSFTLRWLDSTILVDGVPILPASVSCVALMATISDTGVHQATLPYTRAVEHSSPRKTSIQFQLRHESGIMREHSFVVRCWDELLETSR